MLKTGTSTVAALAIASLAASAFAATPKVTGNPAAGKRVWTSSQPRCSLCHTLAAAGAYGTKGPNLDKRKPSYATIVKFVTNGSPPNPRYTVQMQSFGDVLTKKQLQDLAAFVYTATHKTGSP